MFFIMIYYLYNSRAFVEIHYDDIYCNIIIYHGSTTCLVLRRRAHLMDQFDRVFNGFVKHFPFALLETVFGVSLCAIDEQRPSARKYEDKTPYNII